MSLYEQMVENYGENFLESKQLPEKFVSVFKKREMLLNYSNDDGTFSSNIIKSYKNMDENALTDKEIEWLNEPEVDFVTQYIRDIFLNKFKDGAHIVYWSNASNREFYEVDSPQQKYYVYPAFKSKNYVFFRRILTFLIESRDFEDLNYVFNHLITGRAHISVCETFAKKASECFVKHYGDKSRTIHLSSKYEILESQYHLFDYIRVCIDKDYISMIESFIDYISPENRLLLIESCCHCYMKDFSFGRLHQSSKPKLIEYVKILMRKIPQTCIEFRAKLENVCFSSHNMLCLALIRKFMVKHSTLYTADSYDKYILERFKNDSYIEWLASAGFGNRYKNPDLVEYQEACALSDAIETHVMRES